MEIEFEIERATKNTVRYQEMAEGDETDPVQVGTLYVQKWALNAEFDGFPERLIVTIEEAGRPTV